MSKRLLIALAFLFCSMHPASSQSIVITDEVAQSLIGKDVYNKEGKAIGSVKKVERKGTGEIISITVENIGGFLGIGSRTIEITPNQFTFSITLNIDYGDAKQIRGQNR